MADAAVLADEWGIHLTQSSGWLEPQFKKNFQAAMDAQPTLVTNPNASIPSYFTTLIDPEVVRILQAPNKGASILGEEKKGTWVDQTAFFSVIENVGEVSSYGDRNTLGVSDANFQFEQRQAYLFQTVIQYGDLEVDRAGAARLNMVSEKNISAAKTLDKFLDYTYHFGVAGLQNYGILNDPSLPAALTPSTKAYGGVKWVNNGAVVAQASEIYTDIQTLYTQLAASTFGEIDADTAMVLVYPNAVAGALTAVNSFGITIRAFIKESFPNMEFVVDPRYATTSGNVVQLIAKQFGGQATGYCAFNEKMRDHQVVRMLSSYEQKRTAGTWGAIIRYPLAFAQLLGV
nr:major capsid family protein [uncultured Lichenicoccus sp.]